MSGRRLSLLYNAAVGFMVDAGLGDCEILECWDWKGLMSLEKLERSLTVVLAPIFSLTVTRGKSFPPQKTSYDERHSNVTEA